MMRLIFFLFITFNTVLFAQETNKQTYIISFDIKPMSKMTHLLGNQSLSQLHLNNIENLQNLALDKLSQHFNHPFKAKFHYAQAINGLSIELTVQEAEYLASIQGVKSISKEYYLQTTTDAAGSMVNADGVWDGSGINPLPASKGEGIVVGVIDSGINFNHVSFADTPEDGYDFAIANPFGANTFKGWCDPENLNYDASYACNNKIIAAWDFIDSQGNESDGPIDGNFHGSHMSGIISGNYITGAAEGFPDINGGALKAPFISGIAPHSHIIMYDVCDNVIGCAASSILAAIDQSILDGVDVLNYSISGGLDPWSDNSIALAMLNASNLGIITSAAAGNSNAQNPETLGLVNNLAPWIMTSANSFHGRTLSNEVSVISMLTVPEMLTHMYSVISDGVAFMADIESSIVYAKDVNSENENGCLIWDPMDFVDVVALIKSSEDCSDESKIQNAENAGAIAVIIFDAESDIPTQMNEIDSPTIPATMIGLTDGNNLITYLQENSPNLSEIEIVAEATHKVIDALGMVLYRSSYRGPNNRFNVTKPDITAPGTNVLSAILEIPNLPSQYLKGRGTSQSTAVMSGSMALLKNLRPNLTPSELKSAMMLSANDAITFEDGNVTNTDDIGSGMLNLVKAANTVLVMDESIENYINANPENNGMPNTLNLASLRNNDCITNCKWLRSFTNKDDVTHSWSITSESDSGSDILVLSNNTPVTQFTLESGKSITLEISYSMVSGPINEHRFAKVLFTDIESLIPQSKLTLVVYLDDFIFNNGFE